MRALWNTGAGRLACGAVGMLALAVAVALIALWPGSQETDARRGAAPDHEARVVAVGSVRCPTPQQRHCARAKARFTEGPERGNVGSFDASTAGEAAAVDVGNKVFLASNKLPNQELAEGVEPYSLTGFQRHGPLLLLVALFVGFVLLLGRVRGAMALVGLAISLLLVVKFVVPAILDGRSPILVATVGALAVMIVTIALCHGLGAQSIAAILGTTVSLALTLALASIFIGLTNITGASSEESQLVLAGRSDLSLDGLILAGMIIGALGVLDDLTVSQASTVMALRRANPTKRWRELYREAVTVGRDHVAATVNTLVLAYVGAALPILLIFSVGGTTFGEAVNIEEVAIEIVATLVGSIGLITAVPITTALAAVLAARLPTRALPHQQHAH
ncbi:MAG: YibE/F family protein [Acidimicrobiia bacterium]